MNKSFFEHHSLDVHKIMHIYEIFIKFLQFTNQFFFQTFTEDVEEDLAGEEGEEDDEEA